MTSVITNDFLISALFVDNVRKFGLFFVFLEIKYKDIFLIWETIWAANTVASEHFNLFVALAIIELYRWVD